ADFSITCEHLRHSSLVVEINEKRVGKDERHFGVEAAITDVIPESEAVAAPVWRAEQGSYFLRGFSCQWILPEQVVQHVPARFRVRLRPGCARKGQRYVAVV